MIRSTKCYEATLVASPQPVILRVVRRDDSVTIRKRHAQRPTWWLLYTILFLAFVVLWASDYLLPEGLARSLGDLLAVFGCIGLTHLWFRANRWRLVHAKTQVGHTPGNRLPTLSRPRE